MLRFHRFDPTPCGFPRPRVPVLAPLSARQLERHTTPLPDAVRHFTRGRYALKAAYALSGVGPRGALLAPAYHCRTMLDPAVRLGAPIALYPLTPQLEPDLDELRHIATHHAEPIKALLFTHYFGLARDIAPVAALCRDLRISLIEDCSHVMLLGPAAGQALGRTGRYAVSSPYKFFPCADGGLLWSNGDDDLQTVSTQPPGPKEELRGLVDAIRQLLRRKPMLDADMLQRQRSAVASLLEARAREWCSDTDPLSNEYDIEAEAVSSLAMSRWILRHSNRGFFAHSRRQRYLQWADAVADLPGCHALFPALPADCVPYMFPLRVQRPAQCFYPLKHLGLPIWRWDEMALSDCAVSQEYRQGVFHLPCHQQLSDADMRWMIAALHQVMRNR